MRIARVLTAATMSLLAPAALSAQRPASGAVVRDQVRAWREGREAQILRELADLLAIPNVASDRVNIRRNAEALVGMLARRGFTPRILEAEGSPPAVYGELRAPGATRTVVFYAHYDGQPVDSVRWHSSPWAPVLRTRALFDGGQAIPFPEPGMRVDPEARIYARSASDDKSPIVALLAALDALRSAGTPLSVNLKVFLEGEEEAGSDHLRSMLTAHRQLLAGDLWLFADGPVHQSRRLQVVYGVRGVVGLNLTVFGPSRPLHSGHYGNWAPNPNVLLVHLLASMRDENGRITIDQFYDDVRPLSPAERTAFASIPGVEDQLRAELGLAATEGGGASLAERIALPALNVGGIDGGRAAGGGANVIPAASHAYIDFRLVPAQLPARVADLVEAHIRRRGFTIVRQPPDSAARASHPKLIQVTWAGGYPAVRTALDHPGATAVSRIASEVTGQRVIEVPTLGGSLPLFHFTEVLGDPFVIVPIVNHDNNQHGEDENLRIQNLWDGIELFAGLLARLGQAWNATP